MIIKGLPRIKLQYPSIEASFATIRKTKIYLIPINILLEIVKCMGYVHRALHPFRRSGNKLLKKSHLTKRFCLKYNFLFIFFIQPF